MTDDRGARRAAIAGANNVLLRQADVVNALDAARAAMSTIVQDARNFRAQSNSSLDSISDEALRQSVGQKPRHDTGRDAGARIDRRPLSTTPHRSFESDAL